VPRPKAQIVRSRGPDEQTFRLQGGRGAGSWHRYQVPVHALAAPRTASYRTLDQKFSRWFAWLTGILVTALLAQLGLLGAALFRR